MTKLLFTMSILVLAQFSIAEVATIELSTNDNANSLTATQDDEIELQIKVFTGGQSITGFQCFLSFDENLIEAVPYGEFANDWWHFLGTFDGIVIFADDHDSRVGELEGNQLDWCLQTGIGDPRPAYPLNHAVCKIKLRLLQPIDELEINFDHDHGNFRNTTYWLENCDTEHAFTYENGFSLCVLENTSSTSPTMIPELFELADPWPNPFNPSCNFRIDLKRSSDVKLELFDLQGRKIHLLKDGHLSAGSHSFTLDAYALMTGNYFVLFQADNYRQTKRITLIK